MGMISLGRSCSSYTGPEPAPRAPDPKKFRIIRIWEIGQYALAEIEWPNATAYEGHKILLYRAAPSQLRAAVTLDPHFAETIGPLVPIARFEPTTHGWFMANLLAGHLANLDARA